MDLALIATSARTALQRLSERNGGLLNNAAIIDFLRHAQQIGPYDDYKIFPESARALLPTGLLADGTKASNVFLKAAIMQGALETLASERFNKLPARVRVQQIKQLERIVADDDDVAEWLDIEHDLFHKEFGIATLRLYVAGAQLVDFHCGIPRSTLFKGGVKNINKNLAAIFRLGGFRKYFQVHTHTFMLDAFNEEGWNECYLCCADLYKLHPEVLGMYGSSWFYDPALDHVSPRLSYLRLIPRKSGAELFFIEEGGSACNNSLATSHTRRKLYEEGKYSPKNYMLAWGKSQQMAWAKNYLNSAQANMQHVV